MREIKFRGIYSEDEDLFDIGGEPLIKANEMVFGQLVYDGDTPYIVGPAVEACEEYIALESWFPVKPETLGQFTGLHDANGIPIFEGDIVRGNRQITHEVEIPGTMDAYSQCAEFKTEVLGEFRYIGQIVINNLSGARVKNAQCVLADGTEVIQKSRKLKVKAERVEVVGNIYENGDLLTVSPDPKSGEADSEQDDVF